MFIEIVNSYIVGTWNGICIGAVILVCCSPFIFLYRYLKGE